MVLAQVDPGLQARTGSADVIISPPRSAPPPAGECAHDRTEARRQADWAAVDGDRIAKGQKFCTIAGSGARPAAPRPGRPLAARAPPRPRSPTILPRSSPIPPILPRAAHSILVAERVVLNFMQRMSGIATLTAAMAAAAAPARVLDTRKTAPGLRLLDKWAVLIGGGTSHRMGLYDMVLIKDNHIAAAKGITPAVAAARAYLAASGLSVPLEVELGTLADVDELMAATAGQDSDGRGPPVTRAMLDNMSVADMSVAVARIAGRLETEASGNVTLASIGAIGATGVTFVSSGALTHSVAALDISLNIEGDWAKKL